MPNDRPQLVLVETPDIAAVLDAAAQRHPGQTRPQLVYTLLAELAQARGHDDQTRGEGRE